MSDYTIVLPSKPKIVSEEGFSGSYEIDGLYPGYGYTLGNSLRRIILSSLPGAAITSVKISGVSHEFSVINGIKEDVVNILLNLKQVRIKMATSENQTITLKIKGEKVVKASDIKIPGQIEIMNPDLVIAHITDKNTELDMEMTVEQGIGFLTKEVRDKNRVDIGSISLDSNFTPIRRVSYEVENMRVGDRTDFNRLKISIETDGTITPKEALEKSIEIMINQLKAIIGFKEEDDLLSFKKDSENNKDASVKEDTLDEDVLKTRIENLDLSVRTLNSLANANIRTIGGLARKKEKDLLEIEGLGAKGIGEIKKLLSDYGITLK